MLPAQPPKNFAESVNFIKELALEEFDQEVLQKQLYYHTREHLSHVQRHVQLIFEAVRPYWTVMSYEHQGITDLERVEQLLYLCAVTHDMLQIFLAKSEEHQSRHREPGVSEFATVDRLIHFINLLNQHLQAENVSATAQVTIDEMQIIQEAIVATITNKMEPQIT